MVGGGEDGEREICTFPGINYLMTNISNCSLDDI